MSGVRYARFGEYASADCVIGCAAHVRQSAAMLGPKEARERRAPVCVVARPFYIKTGMTVPDSIEGT